MIIIDRHVFSAQRAIAVDVDGALVRAAAPRHVPNQITSVGVVALGWRANRVELLRSTGHISSPLDALGELTLVVLNWHWLQVHVVCVPIHVLV